ncbi:sensor domain-containing phosphodiesterase [Shewanella salipaludis]|uniref:EAL domain-containing protein n=1 Tax=Shewanella salipaludis TaxID=2723052 RepID=A0A972JJU6_9GAMM|nr:EAL domain-containing protein [Shewanella salipaludis]NMH65525.1 EAL domain-containing protein [Shewanella salipaludis]
MHNTLLRKVILTNAHAGDGGITDDLQTILNVVRLHLGMKVAFISEFTQDKRIFKYVDSADDSVSIKVGDSGPLEESYCKKIAGGELPQLIPDTSLNPISQRLAFTYELSIGAYIGVPIYLPDGELYGAFCCYKHEADPTLAERDLALLRAFSDFASIIIANKLKANRLLKEMEDRVGSILTSQEINILYQPIYNFNKERVTGFEALARFHTTPYRTPDVWFDEAAQVGLGEALELMAVTLALKGLQQLPENIFISINSSPEHILSGAIEAALAYVPAERVILEMTEHARIHDYSALRAALEPLRNRGIRLAIDDAGAGYASFQHILELEADIIKLDISLIHNIHKDPKRHALATSLIAFARATGCEVVAEGIETSDELLALRKLGVHKVQGYFIGHPMPLAEAAKCSLNLAHKQSTG